MERRYWSTFACFVVEESPPFQLSIEGGAPSIPAERRGRGVSKTSTHTFRPSLSTLTWRALAISSFSLSHGAFLCVPSLLCTESSVGTSRQAPYPHPDLFPCAEPAALFQVHWCSVPGTNVRPGSHTRPSSQATPRVCSRVPSAPVLSSRSKLCLWGWGRFLGSPALTPSSHSPSFFFNSIYVDVVQSSCLSLASEFYLLDRLISHFHWNDPQKIQIQHVIDVTHCPLNSA